MDKMLLSLAFLFFLRCPSLAQQLAESPERKWAYSANVYYYFVPDENSLTLIATADHRKLHLEARYNYEDDKTGSAFAGWRFQANGKIEFEAVPMLGIVFGNTNGLAPGLELSAVFKKFDLYSESEYVFDFSGNENNFLYTWGELAISLGSFRTGLSYQRTLLYQTDFDLQRGVFAEYSIGKFTAGAYYFNPFSNDAVMIISFGIDF